MARRGRPGPGEERGGDDRRDGAERAGAGLPRPAAPAGGGRPLDGRHRRRGPRRRRRRSRASRCSRAARGRPAGPASSGRCTRGRGAPRTTRRRSCCSPTPISATRPIRSASLVKRAPAAQAGAGLAHGPAALREPGRALADPGLRVLLRDALPVPLGPEPGAPAPPPRRAAACCSTAPPSPARAASRPIRGAVIDDCALARLMKARGPIWLGLTDRAEVAPPLSPASATSGAWSRARPMRSSATRRRCSRARSRRWPGVPVAAAAGPVRRERRRALGRRARLGARWRWPTRRRLRRFGLSPLRALALPAIAAAYTVFTLDSALAERRGLGGMWKGEPNPRQRCAREPGHRVGLKPALSASRGSQSQRNVVCGRQCLSAAPSRRPCFHQGPVAVSKMQDLAQARLRSGFSRQAPLDGDHGETRPRRPSLDAAVDAAAAAPARPPAPGRPLGVRAGGGRHHPLRIRHAAPLLQPARSGAGGAHRPLPAPHAGARIGECRRRLAAVPRRADRRVLLGEGLFRAAVDRRPGRCAAHALARARPSSPPAGPSAATSSPASPSPCSARCPGARCRRCRRRLVLLPRWFPFHLSRISYWARTVLVPLTVVMARRPRPLAPTRRVRGGAVPHAAAPHPPLARRRRPCAAALARGVRGDGRGAARHARPLPRPPPRPRRSRRRALRYRAAERHGRAGRHLPRHGECGADVPLPRRARRPTRASPPPGRRWSGWSTTATTRRPTSSPACRRSGTPRSPRTRCWKRAAPAAEAAARRGLDWLLPLQVNDVAGDWAALRPGLPPGGWAFQYANPHYPDVDDTAAVVLALDRARRLDGVGEPLRRAPSTAPRTGCSACSRGTAAGAPSTPTTPTTT